ncbi:MAG: HD domain-containing phosphohydrolase [SAR324 cluster bacterium]|nr:HD domain-containing phosphohydrolase [SAR324 cluster bacterium]MEE2717261.1 HD domain-containing phosphohydrolase [SAR324 cluster bacterium]
MSQPELWIPKTRSKDAACQVPKSVQEQVRIRQYQEFKEIAGTPGQTRLIVIDEAGQGEWEQAQREFPPETGALLLDFGSRPDLSADPQQLLGWVTAAGLTERRWEFLITQALETLAARNRVQELEESLGEQHDRLEELNEIGVSLSGEKNLTRLLRLIIANAMKLTHADGGSLYLLEQLADVPEDPDNYLANQRLRFEVLINDSRQMSAEAMSLEVTPNSIYGQVILTGKPILIDDVYDLPKIGGLHWGDNAVDEHYGYRTKSMLTVPMLNEGRVIGVLQLVNRKQHRDRQLGDVEDILSEVCPFDDEDLRVIESIASQAATALSNAQLVDSIHILFDGFINASVKAIESRDPTTSGHSSRVATLTIALAELVHQMPAGKFRETRFSVDQLNEIRYASLLHDFGKIGVREQVLIKAKKLYPNEEQAVMDRFRLIRQSLELSMTRKQLEYFLEQSREDAVAAYQQGQQELEERLRELDERLKFIIRCNEPTVMAQGGFEKLQEIAQLHFAHPSGVEIPYLNAGEMRSLSVPKGSLNVQDRAEIESHVTHTYNFLSIIPWSANLLQVPEIAYAHHEKLNGSGYPRKLNGEEIPLQAKMMTIADIYDALTAWDRPYKKAMPPERAFNILGFEAKDGHIDTDLLEVFIDAKLYTLVSRPRMG